MWAWWWTIPAAGSAYSRPCGGRRLLAAAEPAIAIRAHGVNQVCQCLTLLGQRVLDLGRHLGVGAAMQHALTLERREPLGKRLGADANQRALELAETLRASRQVAEDEERPLAAHNLSCAGNGADDLLMGGGRAILDRRTLVCHTLLLLPVPRRAAWRIHSGNRPK